MADWRASARFTHRWRLDRPVRLRWWEADDDDDDDDDDDGETNVDLYWVDGCRRRTSRTHARKCVAPRAGSASTSSGASCSQAESSTMKERAPRRISRLSTMTPLENMTRGAERIPTSSNKSLEHLPHGGRQLSWF